MLSLLFFAARLAALYLLSCPSLLDFRLSSPNLSSLRPPSLCCVSCNERDRVPSVVLFPIVPLSLNVFKTDSGLYFFPSNWRVSLSIFTFRFQFVSFEIWHLISPPLFPRSVSRSLDFRFCYVSPLRTCSARHGLHFCTMPLLAIFETG